MRYSLACFASLSLALGVACLTGCGGDAPAPPTASGELTEAQKQQIRELNEQRSEEWGTPKKK